MCRYFCFFTFTILRSPMMRLLLAKTIQKFDGKDQELEWFWTFVFDLFVVYKQIYIPHSEGWGKFWIYVSFVHSETKETNADDGLKKHREWLRMYIYTMIGHQILVYNVKMASVQRRIPLMRNYRSEWLETIKLGMEFSHDYYRHVNYFL
jgi:hypothetical protein